MLFFWAPLPYSVRVGPHTTHQVRPINPPEHWIGTAFQRTRCQFANCQLPKRQKKNDITRELLWLSSNRLSRPHGKGIANVTVLVFTHYRHSNQYTTPPFLPFRSRFFQNSSSSLRLHPTPSQTINPNLSLSLWCSCLFKLCIHSHWAQWLRDETMNSITSVELNYLVFRYLQESGNVIAPKIFSFFWLIFLFSSPQSWLVF